MPAWTILLSGREYYPPTGSVNQSINMELHFVWCHKLTPLTKLTMTFIIRILPTLRVCYWEVLIRLNLWFNITYYSIHIIYVYICISGLDKVNSPIKKIPIELSLTRLDSFEAIFASVRGFR